MIFHSRRHSGGNLGRRAVLAVFAGLALLAATSASVIGAPIARKVPVDRDPLPTGATQVKIENLEGVVLVPATLRGSAGRDTVGLLVVDTGAGFLGLDAAVATRLGLIEPEVRTISMSLIPATLKRLELGGAQLDAISPILLLDADVIRRATGRNVLGLAGQGVFAGRALWLDYERERMVFVASPLAAGAGSARSVDSLEATVPGAGVETERSANRVLRAAQSRAALGPLLSAAAVPLPFRMAGDRKIVVRGRFRENAASAPSAWLELVFDTGATKNVFFESALLAAQPTAQRWKSITGLVAPTLAGNSSARIALAPVFELESLDGARPLARERVDCAVISSGLADALSNSIGRAVAGLVGYSFFKDYRVAIDYPNRILWLDPAVRRARPGPGTRPYEYSHAGLQLERNGESICVLGIAAGSPAEQAGIMVGDTLVSIGSKAVSADALSEASLKLEGPPGTPVLLTLLREGISRSYRLVRRQLL